MSVPIETLESFNPPDINITIYLDKSLTPEQEEKVQRLIISWYDVGVHGGYGEGYLHFMHEIIFDDEKTISLTVDYGSYRSWDALKVLCKILEEEMKIYHVGIRKIELG